MAASTQVFTTVELLESVLDHATLNDLLVWQRVNSTFRDIIKRSRFQRKLFFKADTHVKADEEICHKLLHWNTFPDGLWQKHFGINSNMAIMGIKKRDSFYIDHPSGSWKDMFLTSPAINHVEVDVMDGVINTLHSVKIMSDHGITLGQLVEEAVQFEPLEHWHYLVIRPWGSRRGCVSAKSSFISIHYLATNEYEEIVLDATPVVKQLPI